ncbi:hypothetical protein QWJ34_16210 [Saccharibacillus sp. CPCC 101409]|nr:hypothetical protein [Saccharibacillus sp. CPCC 101409]MDO3411310.1 hypothetical protein [Saccharibacillus sp. CPCC 101409]
MNAGERMPLHPGRTSAHAAAARRWSADAQPDCCRSPVNRL